MCRIIEDATIEIGIDPGRVCIELRPRRRHIAVVIFDEHTTSFVVAVKPFLSQPVRDKQEHIDIRAGQRGSSP